MQRAVLLVALAAVATILVVIPAQAAPDRAAGAERYIVVLKQGVNATAVAELHAGRFSLSVGHVYRHALAGYAAAIPAARLAAVAADPNVAYVEPDGVMAVARPAQGPTVQTVPWGIQKVGAVGKTLAATVNVYIIDTGIATHADLNLVGHVNFAGGQNSDCHGHGTHVAGTAAAIDNTRDVVGVAAGAPLVGVKVLSCSGSGSTSGVIAGVDWVTANASGKRAVANMSLGGSASQALDDAVRASAQSGVTYAVAAGNSGANACNSSPARAGAGTNNGIVTVAATDSNDNEASWSNYGSCVDIWAPGVSILSTARGGGTTTMSGTSMASPHVAGGAALYLSGLSSGASPAQVEQALKSAAQPTGKQSKDGRAITRLWVGGF